MMRVPRTDIPQALSAQAQPAPALDIALPKPDAATARLQAAVDVARDLQAWSAAGTAWEDEYTQTHTGAAARDAAADALAFHQKQFQQLRDKYSGNLVALRQLRDNGTSIGNQGVSSMVAFADMENVQYTASVLAAEEQNLREIMTSPHSTGQMREKAFASYVFKMENVKLGKGEPPEAVAQWKDALHREVVSEALLARFDRIMDDDPREALALAEYARGEEPALHATGEQAADPEALRALATEYRTFVPPDALQVLYNRADAEKQFRSRLAQERADAVRAGVEASMLRALDGGELTFFEDAAQELAGLNRPAEAEHVAALGRAMTRLQPYLERSRFVPFSEQRSRIRAILDRSAPDAPDAPEPSAHAALAIVERGIAGRERQFRRDPAGYIAAHLLLGQEGMSDEQFRELDRLSREDFFSRSLTLQEALCRETGISPRVLPAARAAEIRDQYERLETPLHKAERLRQLTSESGAYAHAVLAEAGLPVGVAVFAGMLPALAVSEVAKLAEAAATHPDALPVPDARKAAVQARVQGSSLFRAIAEAEGLLSGAGFAGPGDELRATLERFVALGGNLDDLERRIALDAAPLARELEELADTGVRAVHAALAAQWAQEIGLEQTTEAVEAPDGFGEPADFGETDALGEIQTFGEAGDGRTFLAQQAHGFGVGLCGVVDGITGAADFVASPMRAILNGVNGLLGGNPDYFKPIGSSLSDALGLPQPEGAWEELVHALNRGGTEAITTIWGANALMAYKCATSAPGTVWAAVNSFTIGPAGQIASGAAADAAAVAAQQAGAGPLGVLAASLAGGMVGGKVAGGRKRNRLQAAAEDAPPLTTTNHETGVTGQPRANREIMASADWRDAKKGERRPANRIVQKLWTSEHTEKLKAKLDPVKETVFLAVPSTTGENMIPDALARKLAQDLGGQYVDVKKVYKVDALSAMKELPRSERPFSQRTYELVDESTLAAIKDKPIVITEDVITTGSSLRQFALELRRQGLEVQTVAGLMGNARLDAPPQLKNKLHQALRHSGMGLKGNELANILSAGEIEAIIQYINKTGGTYERRALARRIQGILDSRTVKNLEKLP